jgi:hypothetical protein
MLIAQHKNAKGQEQEALQEGQHQAKHAKHQHGPAKDFAGKRWTKNDHGVHVARSSGCDKSGQFIVT